MWILLIAGACLILLAGVLLWTGRETQRLVNVMKRAVPTRAERVPSLIPGELVSITGTARSSNPLISEHGNVPCLYYSCSVERDYETSEYEHGTKERSGRYVTRKHSETVSSNTQSTAFTVEDDSGSATIIPNSAEFDARETLNRYEPARSNGNSVSLGGFTINLGNGDRTLGYRYRESIIPLNAPVYVVGVVSEDGEIVTPQSTRDDAALIISYRKPAALIEDWQSSARWQAYGSIGSGLAGAGAVLSAVIILIF